MSQILPIRVTSFEKHFLLDDRPGYRMTFTIDHTFEGEIDREAFEASLQHACDRHPLLNSLLERRAFGRWWWMPPQNVRPKLDWASSDVPVDLPEDPRIDLAKEVGVRIFVRVGNGRSRLTVQFHHACTDGVGAIQFMSDLFASYVRRLMPHASNLPDFQPNDHRQLKLRNRLNVYWNTIREWFQINVRTLQIGYDTQLFPPAPLANPAGGKRGSPLGFPGTVTRTLSDDIHDALRRQARKLSVTTNELLVREVFLTCRDWNERQGISRPKDRLSIMVPANMRTLEHNRLPAANLVGYMWFYRPAEMGDDPTALLESLRVDSEYFKRTRLPVKYNQALSIVSRIPGLLPFLVHRQHCCATAVLSAVGDPSRAIATQYPVDGEGNPIMANLVLTDINSAPPIRPLTRASFTSWHFNKKQRLGVRCDPANFSHEQSQELLDMLAERVIAQAELAAEGRRSSRRAA